MAKRFIDTELFNDSWFIDLSKDAKISWVYFITRCNHAGIIEINESLFKVQTGCNSLETVIEQLSNRLVTVKNGVYFIPKFIEFQYPNFPNSRVKQQYSAIEILKKYNLFPNTSLSVSQGLSNPYGNVNESVNGNGSGSGSGEDVNPGDKTPGDHKKDFVDKVIDVWCEKYEQVRGDKYIITTPGKERLAAGKIANLNKKMFEKQDSLAALNSIGAIFEMCLNIDDPWLFDNMNMTTINSKFNEIKTKLNGKNRRNNKGGATNQELAEVLRRHINQQEDAF